MSRPDIFFDSGNVGVSFGEYLVYAHWTTIVISVAVVAAIVGWLFSRKHPNDPRP